MTAGSRGEVSSAWQCVDGGVHLDVCFAIGSTGTVSRKELKEG